MVNLAAAVWRSCILLKWAVRETSAAEVRISIGVDMNAVEAASVVWVAWNAAAMPASMCQ